MVEIAGQVRAYASAVAKSIEKMEPGGQKS